MDDAWGCGTDGRNMAYSSRRTKSPRAFIGRLQGDPSVRGLGYVDIKSVSFGGYLETELSQHNPARKQMGHPVLPSLNRAKRKEKDDNVKNNELIILVP